MELKQVSEEMKKLQEAGDDFLKDNEEKIIDFLRKEEMTA